VLIPVAKIIRAELTVEGEDLIHNDLSSAAFYLVDRVRQRIAHEDGEGGLFLEMMAAFAMTAFSLEAYVNFIGEACMADDWPEMRATLFKLRTVYERLGLAPPDASRRPYSTVDAVVKLRNTLAHGKPFRWKRTEVITGTYDELLKRSRNATEAGWAATLTPEFVQLAYEDVEAIWKEMLDASKIDIVDTMRGGSSGLRTLTEDDTLGRQQD